MIRAPSSSTSASETASSSAGKTLTRTFEPPRRPFRIPLQEKGSRASAVLGRPGSRACRAASSRAGWIAKRSASSALLLGQRDLGVDLLAACARRRCRPWKAGPYSKPALGEAVIEVRRPRAARRPRGARRRGARVAGGRSAERAPVALRVHSRLLFALGAGVDRDLAAALLVGRGDRDLDRHRARLGQDQRRLQGQLLDRSRRRPARRPAAPARRRRCRAGGRCRRRRGRPARGGWRGRGGR